MRHIRIVDGKSNDPPRGHTKSAGLRTLPQIALCNAVSAEAALLLQVSRRFSGSKDGQRRFRKHYRSLMGAFIPGSLVRHEIPRRQ